MIHCTPLNRVEEHIIARSSIEIKRHTNNPSPPVSRITTAIFHVLIITRSLSFNRVTIVQLSTRVNRNKTSLENGKKKKKKKENRINTTEKLPPLLYFSSTVPCFTSTVTTITHWFYASRPIFPRKRTSSIERRRDNPALWPVAKIVGGGNRGRIGCTSRPPDI